MALFDAIKAIKDLPPGFAATITYVGGDGAAVANGHHVFHPPTSINPAVKPSLTPAECDPHLMIGAMLLNRAKGIGELLTEHTPADFETHMDSMIHIASEIKDQAKAAGQVRDKLREQKAKDHEAIKDKEAALDE